MNKSLLKVVNVIVDGKRTSVSLTPIQINIAKDFASFRNMSFSKYIGMLIDAGLGIDKRYSRSEAIRDGLIMELHTILMDSITSMSSFNSHEKGKTLQ